jgi:hypothetical protein
MDDLALVESIFREFGFTDIRSEDDKIMRTAFGPRYFKVGDRRYYYTLSEHILYVGVMKETPASGSRFIPLEGDFYIDGEVYFNLADPGCFRELVRFVTYNWPEDEAEPLLRRCAEIEGAFIP